MMRLQNYPNWLKWGVGLLLLAPLGCRRDWYRQQADEEVQELVEEKTYSRWSTPYRGVDMDARSRFFDGNDPVRPPMPPDDAESHKLMHHIDGKKHWDHWHDNGDLTDLENPSWQDDLPNYVKLNDDGKVVLDLPEAVRLSLIHSPTYQQQLETIYLSALDVSTERFRFVTQFFGRAGAGPNGTFFNNTSGSITNTPTATGVRDTTNLGVNTDVAVRQRMATAGELIVGFANSFVWQFSGNGSNFASSAVNFSLVQPLLRGAGRQIALEQLTIAERTLLSNLRAFEGYRQGFYTQVAIGENNVAGPTRRGGFQGGSGLSGFSGQGSGGFGAVGDATGFGRNAGANFGAGGGAGGSGSGFAGGGAGTVGGFIGLLQVQQQIRNTETSLRQQLQTLDLLEAHLDAGLIDIAQVDQFRQSIQTERANLLQSRNGLQNQLDTFKTGTLGLPPDLPIELDDTFIRPFQLLDPQLQALQGKLQDIVNHFGELPDPPAVADLKAVLAQLGTLKANIDEQVRPVEADIERMRQVRDARLKSLDDIEQKFFDRDLKQLAENLDNLKERVAAIGTRLKSFEEGLDENTAKATAKSIIATNVELSNMLSELSLVQARARVECLTVDKIDLTPELGLEVARNHRFDWMNNRAALVDTWRLIEFNGNRLESNIDVFVNGNLGTVGDNPVRFGTDNSSVAAGVRFDAPFNRLQERNDFRQQLVVYQQARRQMILFEDSVHRTVRQLLRDLEQLRVNLEIQRRAVAIAIRRADQTRENLNKPAAPAQPGAGPTQFGPTAATNLLTALSDLRNSQNNFMSVWLNYQAGRMRLMRELGIMRIDETGMWIDESLESAVQAAETGEPLPPAVPRKWFDALDAIDATDSSKSAPAPAPAAESTSVAPSSNTSPSPASIQVETTIIRVSGQQPVSEAESHIQIPTTVAPSGNQALPPGTRWRSTAQ